MKVYKKLISVVVVIVLVITMVCSMPMSASAATLTTTQNASIKIDAQCLYSEAFEVLKFTNELRRERGLKELKMDPDLLEAGMQRATELALYFSHTRPDDSSWMTTGEYVYAENAAMLDRSAAAVVDSWKNSSGHMGNMMLSNVDSIGVGAVFHNGVYYWIQIFATQGESITEIPEDCTKTFEVELGEYIYDLTVTTPDKLLVGDIVSLEVKGTNRGNKNAPFILNNASFEWTSSNNDIVKIENGKLNVIDTGDVTVSVGDYSETFTVKLFSEGSNNKCGENITWSYANNTLTLTGSGEMYDYSTAFSYINGSKGSSSVNETDVPWYDAFSHVEKIIVGEGITTIGDYAFACFEKVKEVSLPSTLIEIGAHAFDHASIREVDLPENLTTIGEYAFLRSDLKQITIPDSVETIGRGAFEYCDGFSSVVIPSTVTDLGWDVFKNCYMMKEATVEYGISKIPESTFEGCTNLIKVSIPNTVIEIGGAAFKDCKKLVDVKIPENLKLLDNQAFYCCTSLEEVLLPETLEFIGWGAFRSCVLLEEVVIPASVKEFGAGVFDYCHALTTITVLNPTMKFAEKGDYYYDDMGVTFRCIKGSLAYIECVTKGYKYELIDAPELIGEVNGYNHLFGTAATNDIKIELLSTPDEYTVLFSKGEYFNIHESFGSVAEMVNFYHTTPSSSKRDYGYLVKAGVYPISYFIYSGKLAPITGAVDIVIEKFQPDYYFSDSELTVTWYDKMGSKPYWDLSVIREYNHDPIYKVVSSNEDAIIAYGSYFRVKDYGEVIIKAYNEGSDNWYAYETNAKVIVTYVGDYEHNEYTLNMNEDKVVGVKKYNGTSTSPVIPSQFYDLYITEIQDGAFSGTDIESIRISEMVSAIGKDAFVNCDKLTSVTIPESVTTIDDYAFGFNCKDGKYTKTDFVISGYYGSAAEEYAAKFGIEFTCLDKPNHKPTLPTESRPIVPEEPLISFPDFPNDAIYFENPENWESVSAYVWDENGNNMGEWPGEVCRISPKYDLWYIECDEMYDYVIFSNTFDGNQKTPVIPIEHRPAILRFDGADYYWEELTPYETNTTDPEESEIVTQPDVSENITEPVEVTTAPDKSSNTTDPAETIGPDVVTMPSTETSTETSTEADETESSSDIPEPSSSTEPSTTAGETNPTEPAEDKGLLGDVNGDSKVNIKDATLIQKAAAKILSLTEDENIRANVNGDAKVNVKDATAIQKFAAKIETGYPISKPII